MGVSAGPPITDVWGCNYYVEATGGQIVVWLQSHETQLRLSYDEARKLRDSLGQHLELSGEEL